jgi:hypothetical protein
VDRLGWAGSFTVRAGDYHLGVRASSEELVSALAGMLAAHVVDDPEAGPNFSVQLVTDGGTRRPFHFLFQQSITAVRSRSPERILRALLSYLTYHALEEREDLVTVHSLAFVRDGQSVLVPHLVRLALKKVERHFNRAGFALVDTPNALIDPSTGDLVVPEPALEVDHDALAAAARLAPQPDRPDTIVAPGRYPITYWAFGGGEGEEISPARALSEAVPLLLGDDQHDPGRVFELLGGLLTRAPAMRANRWERETIDLLAARSRG